MLTPRLEPPYFAVIFSSIHTGKDVALYEQMAERMVTLASQQPGYLGIESVRGSDGMGITLSYWRDLASIANWRGHIEHLEAQANGRARWYGAYALRICRVERESHFPSDASPTDAAEDRSA